MKHFSIAAWADLARGLVSEDEVSEMGAHLASDCAECKNIAEFLSKMSTISRRLAGKSAPMAAVQLAKLIFPRPIEQKRIFRVAAELVFDSRMTTAVTGMRSVWQVGWQCIYRAGECSLDLRIEPEWNTSRVAVIGQISNHNVPDDQMSDLTVRLKAGRSVVAETRSNQFGEFQLEYEQQTRLQLCIYLDGGSRRIQVPLKRFVPDKSGTTDHLNLAALAAKRRKGTGS